MEIVLRQYQYIWEKVKNEGFAKVHAPLHLHKRIIKAVSKEKNIDIGFKILCQERRSNYHLINDINGEYISFYLKDATPIYFNL